MLKVPRLLLLEADFEPDYLINSHVNYVTVRLSGQLAIRVVPRFNLVPVI